MIVVVVVSGDGKRVLKRVFDSRAFARREFVECVGIVDGVVDDVEEIVGGCL